MLFESPYYAQQFASIMDFSLLYKVTIILGFRQHQYSHRPRTGYSFMMAVMHQDSYCVFP